MVYRKSVLGAVLCILALYTPARAQLVFPHFAQGGGYQTTFTLTNLSGTAMMATLQVFLDNGALLENVEIPLTPNGTATRTLTGADLTVGWARVMLSPVVGVAGLETIQLTNNGRVIADASMAPLTPNTTFRFPIIERDGITTGIAITNPGEVEATINLLLRDQSGAPVATQVFSLGPSQHIARFTPQFFQGIGSPEGSVEVSSPAPIAVLALKQLPAGIFSTVPNASPASPSESLFSPGGGIAARLIQAIQRTRTSIDIAIYTFTETEVADALIAAKNRGVSLRIIADSEQATAVGSVIPRLEGAGFQIKRTQGVGSGLMHDKYAIFDGQELVTGSYNWSGAAETRNFENAIFIREASTVSSYQANFISIWNTR